MSTPLNNYKSQSILNTTRLNECISGRAGEAHTFMLILNILKCLLWQERKFFQDFFHNWFWFKRLVVRISLTLKSTQVEINKITKRGNANFKHLKCLFWQESISPDFVSTDYVRSYSFPLFLIPAVLKTQKSKM